MMGPAPRGDRGGVAGPSPASRTLPTELHATMGGAHEGPILAVRFSVSGAYLLTCGKDRTFRLWNPFKGALIKTYTGHAHEVRDVSCARDNAKMTTGGGDKQVFLWDVATGQKIRRFRGHDAAVNAVSFAADDQVVVSAGYDRAVKFWDVRSNSIDAIQSVCAWKDSVTSLAITRNHCVTAASVDGSIRTMDLRAGRATADALGSEHPITSVRASGDERCFLLSVLGGRCVLLDRGDGDVLAEYRGHVHDEVSVESRLTRDDSHVASGSEDGKVVFWDLVEANIAATVDAHPGKACVSLAMHPTKDAMATCGTDGVARLWGPTAGRGVF